MSGQSDAASQEMEKNGVRHAARGAPDEYDPCWGRGHTGSVGSAGSRSVDA